MADNIPAFSFLEIPHSAPSAETLRATPAPLRRVVELASLTEAVAADASKILSVLLNNSVQREAGAEDERGAEGHPLTPATEQALLRFMANTFHLLEREASSIVNDVTRT